MMHRYVIAIATKVGAPAFETVSRRLDGRLERWTQALQSDLARAWVFQAPPSQLGQRKLGAEGCLIGLDFNPGARDISTLLDQTWGAYVAVSVDPVRRSVTVLRDPTGRIECWRLSLDGVDILFSSYEDVFWLQERQSSLNWDYLGHHLNQDFLHGEETGLTDVAELLAGQTLVYTDGICATAMRWWPHHIAARPHANVDIALTAIRSAAENVVSAWADRYSRIELELSGGLDSSIILGLLKHRAPDRMVIGLNRVYSGAQGDETSFARQAAQMHGIDLIEHRQAAGEGDFSNQLSRRLMRPRLRTMTLDDDEVIMSRTRPYRAEAVFTGTAGDHLFFASLPISAASDYSFRAGGLAGFMDMTLDVARLSGNTVWSVFAEVLKYRLGRRAKLRDLGALKNTFLSPEGLGKADYERFIHPWVTAALARTPPAKMTQVMWLVELQRHYFRYGRADSIEEVHPLFSQPVMEACLATPAYWFGLDGLPRGLARRAFADLLPPAIRNRRSKGVSTAYHLEALSKHLPRIRELLLEGHLARRGLLDRAVVERALTPMGMAAAKDMQALVTCLPAEIWIQQTESDRASADASRREPAVA